MHLVYRLKDPVWDAAEQELGHRRDSNELENKAQG